MHIKTRPIVMSRRSFLRNLSLLATGSLLAACAVGEEGALPSNRLESAFTGVQVPGPHTETAMQQEEPELDGFLALSALLTGVDVLDPALGALYLQSLQESPNFTVTVTELLEQAQAGQASLPTTMEELESSGIFENEATRTLADKITEYWYTGIYESAQGEQMVATYIDALAWRTLVFTKPMSVCGSYRFWTEPPEAAID